jgi:hypothetical protein
MNALFLFSALVLLASGSASPPQDGSRLLLRNDGLTATYLEGSTAAAGTVRSLTIRRVFRGPGEHAYALDRLELDCAAGTYRYRDIVIYDRDDDVVNRYQLTDQPATIAPESYLETARHAVCGAPSAPAAQTPAAP